MKRKLYWHHPALYLLILVSLFIYVIVAMIVRKHAKIEIGICDRHMSKRKRDVALSWALALTGVGLIITAAVISSGWTGLTGAVVFLGALIYAAVSTPVVSATK